MKHFFITCCTALLISACSQQVDFSETNVVSGRIFEASTNKPFSGKVTNIPYIQLPIQYATAALQMYVEISGSKSILNSIQKGGISAFMNDSGKDFPIVCDITVKEGNLSGPVSCHINGNTHLEIFSFNFENNALNGEIKISDLNNEQTSTIPVFNGNMVNGKLDGKFTISSKHTGKIIATGQLISGKLDGERVFYSADGTLFEKDNYTKGTLVSKTIYNPQTGQPFTTAVYNEYGQHIMDWAKVEFIATNEKGELADKIRIFRVTEYQSFIQEDGFKNTRITKKIYYNVDTGALLGVLTYKDGSPFNGIDYGMNDKGIINDEHNREYINGNVGKTKAELEQEEENAKQAAEYERIREEEKQRAAAEQEIQARELEREFRAKVEEEFQNCLQNTAVDYPNLTENEIQRRCEIDKEFMLK
ncbi:hypothetical protein MIS45_08935 [Wielerella bovis]|uniref:hypothetical protein n=1 Tax=Wielerella bovis TaxID=2917790 RepID=UPI0020199F96|nr:hypothetical protein [Wielerella bovis]ULJ68890.1 hypothetical protein MIS45_08935 [Wielerella bovis]